MLCVNGNFMAIGWFRGDWVMCRDATGVLSVYETPTELTTKAGSENSDFERGDQQRQLASGVCESREADADPRGASGDAERVYGLADEAGKPGRRDGGGDERRESWKWGRGVRSRVFGDREQGGEGLFIPF